MDYTQYIIPLGIIVYAIFEYQRREQLHRERMELLKRDIELPPPQTVSTVAKIVLTGVVGISLLGLIVWFTVLALKHGFLRIEFIFVMLVYVILFVFIFLMLKKNIKEFRSQF